MAKGYHQYCGIARALDVVGERWTLLIVRELLLGPRRYGELLLALDGLTTNLLALRLRTMKKRGLIRKMKPADLGYELTEEGRALEPVLFALGEWGWRSMGEGPKRSERTELRWALISMKRRFRGVDGELSVELRASEGEAYLVTTDDMGRPKFVQGAEGGARLTLRGDTDPLRALVAGRASAKELEAKGALVIDGQRSEWNEFVDAFQIRP